jgi:hypothetical protein
LYSILSLVLLLSYIGIVPIHVNDDTCVYFNYARSFLDGNWFAYDQRGMQSNGFTGWLYLILLIPFEFLSVNMMFAGILLNALALALFVVFFVLILHHVGACKTIDEYFAVGFITFVFIVSKSEIKFLTGRALETMLGPAMVLGGIYFALRCILNKSFNAWHPGLFFLFCMLAFLVRPENILVMAGVGVLLLIFCKERKRLLIHTGLFAGVLGLYFAASYLIFNDLFPTGYYRKAASIHHDSPGEAYVIGCIERYKWYLIPFVACFLFLAATWRRFRYSKYLLMTLAMFVVAGCIPLVYSRRIVPIVAGEYRYLVNYYLLLFLTIPLSLVLILRLIEARIPKANHLLMAITFVALGWTVAYQSYRENTLLLIDGLAKNRIAEEVTSTHKYLNFGDFLREHLPDPEQIVIFFGDAGCIPYASHCSFIDANGLTEQFIAKLFREPHSLEKMQKFNDYVMQWPPDILIIGGFPNEKGEIVKRGHVHGPFENQDLFPIYKNFAEHGYRFVSSYYAYYNLLFLVRNDSPRRDEIARVLKGFSGLFPHRDPAHGLYIVSNGRRAFFPPYRF